jgi:hypothetical protein
MARNNNSYIKKVKADKRAKKRKEKFQKRIDRNRNSEKSSFENMIAYVDKFGNITSEPPEDSGIVKIDQ